MDTFMQSYIETALWSSTDDNGEPLDSSKYADVELDPQTVATFQDDCTRFVTASTPLIEAFLSTADDSKAREYNLSQERIAHDFWLTRNRHGAGFWDGDYPEPLATQLTDLAHGFGECFLDVVDGKFYAS